MSGCLWHGLIFFTALPNISRHDLSLLFRCLSLRTVLGRLSDIQLSQRHISALPLFHSLLCRRLDVLNGQAKDKDTTDFILLP